jgi:hypothetical protein
MGCMTGSGLDYGLWRHLQGASPNSSLSSSNIFNHAAECVSTAHFDILSTPSLTLGLPRTPAA